MNWEETSFRVHQCKPLLTAWDYTTHRFISQTATDRNLAPRAGLLLSREGVKTQPRGASPRIFFPDPSSNKTREQLINLVTCSRQPNTRQISPFPSQSLPTTTQKNNYTTATQQRKASKPNSCSRCQPSSAAVPPKFPNILCDLSSYKLIYFQAAANSFCTWQLRVTELIQKDLKEEKLRSRIASWYYLTGGISFLFKLWFQLLK